MDVLYVIIPVAIFFAGVGVLAFVWSVRSGQYDDMKGPGEKVVVDD